MRARPIASVWNAIADPRAFEAIRIVEPMTAIGTRVDEIGTLLREGNAFLLRRDSGGRYRLELQCTPADLVERRVRLRGTLVGRDLVAVDRIAPS